MKHLAPTKRWLVVDDDPAVLALTAALLRSFGGGEVVAYGNPRQALDVFLTASESFDLLVTDFEMPGLDGFELATRVRARSPGLPVLVLSGSGLEATDVLGAGLDGFVAKPFSHGELLKAVQGLLNNQLHHAGTSAPRAQMEPEAHSPALTGSRH